MQRRNDEERDSDRDVRDDSFRDGHQSFRIELDIPASSSGADEHRGVVAHGVVHDRRQAALLPERADSADDVSRHPLGVGGGGHPRRTRSEDPGDLAQREVARRRNEGDDEPLVGFHDKGFEDPGFVHPERKSRRFRVSDVGRVGRHVVFEVMNPMLDSRVVQRPNSGGRAGHGENSARF